MKYRKKKLHRACEGNRYLLLKTNTQLLLFTNCSSAHLTVCNFCKQIPLLPFQQMLSFPKEYYLCCDLHLLHTDRPPVPTEHVQCHFRDRPVSFPLHHWQIWILLLSQVAIHKTCHWSREAVYIWATITQSLYLSNDCVLSWMFQKWYLRWQGGKLLRDCSISWATVLSIKEEYLQIC